MQAMTYESELIELTRQMDDEKRERLLIYARALKSRPKGISGEEAFRIAQELDFDPEELDLMERAINEEFEPHLNTAGEKLSE